MPDPELAAEAGMVKNTANTNVIRHAGRILALMEGARPTELTAELDTVGEYDFDGSLVGPMTAHPRWDPRSGELHFFGYGPFPPYLRYHVADAAGRLVRSIEVPLERPVMMHDFVVTESSAVFFDLPALFDVEAMLAGGAAVRWAPEAGARIGVLPRDGGTATWIELDPCFVFHFVNAFDRPDGTIVVDGCRAPAMPTAFGDEAMPDGSVRPSLHRWEIDAAAGTVRETQLDDRPADFPRVADAVGGLPYRYGYLGHAATWDGTVRFDGVTKWDLEANSSATYVYGPHASAGEAVFAPDPAGDGEDAGWLLNFVTDLDTNTSRFVVLDARDVEAGPVAEVPLPRRVPFGFHGNWMADD
jgi:carotenoid cleavage dioxygenase